MREPACTIGAVFEPRWVSRIQEHRVPGDGEGRVLRCRGNRRRARRKPGSASLQVTGACDTLDTVAKQLPKERLPNPRRTPTIGAHELSPHLHQPPGDTHHPGACDSGDSRCRVARETRGPVRAYAWARHHELGVAAVGHYWTFRLLIVRTHTLRVVKTRPQPKSSTPSV